MDFNAKNSKNITVYIFAGILIFINIFRIQETKFIVRYSSVEGRIIKIYHNKNVRNSPYFTINNRNVYDERLIHSEKLFNSAKIGDYLIKKSGTLNYLLINAKNDTLIFNDVE